jgi:Proline-rich nuclear receptor coactivator motif
MSTQQPSITPMKGPRNPRRQQQRKNQTPASQGKTVMLTTPPSSPPPTASPGEVYNGDHNGSRKKNVMRSGKKSRENTRPNNPAYSNGVSHRHTSSQPSVTSPPPLKDSPHYAGPTFHASPAPSALPMPTFFSKSVPDSGLSASLELENESDEESASELTPSKPKVANPRINHEPSPLDFLFKAAIDARGKTQQSPEVASRNATSNSDLKYSQRPEPSANGIFSLELDGPERDMSPYSTPVSSYKDRMNALTSGGNQHHPKAEMDDVQRRAKTEELKHLLLNPRPQRPASASPQLKDPAHIHPHSNGVRYPVNPTLHASSGPPTPVSFNGLPQHDTFPAHRENSPYMSTVQAGYYPPAFRRDFSPYASPVNAARTAYGPPSSQSPFRGAPNSQRYQSPTTLNAKFQHTPPSRPPEHDTKKMEDDLRRILKLDMATGIQPNSVQSSMA